MLDKTSVGTSSKDANPLAERNPAKASFVGASTVKSPPLKVVNKSPSAAVRASTSMLNSGVAAAVSTIVNTTCSVGSSLSSLSHEIIKKLKVNKNSNLFNFNTFFIKLVFNFLG